MSLTEPATPAATSTDAGRGDAVARAYAVAAGLQRQGRLPEAEQIYRSILAVEPDHVGSLLGMGTALRALGRLDEALAQYRIAIAIRPDDAGAHNNLAGVLVMLGRPEEAIASFGRSLAIRPDFAEAHFNVGSALAALDRHDEAIARYEQAIAIRPHFAAAYNNLGNALAKLGRLEEAIARYQRALAVAPDHAEALCNLGNAHQALGRWDEAITYYEKALAARPDLAEAHNSLGSVLQKLGRIDEAVAHHERALALMPAHAEAHNNLGNACHALGRTGDAVVHYERAISLRPDLAEAHYGRGTSLEVLGRLAEAGGAFARAVELAPTKADFHLALAHAKPFAGADPRFPALEALLDPQSPDRDQQIALHFTLGKAYADIDQPERSFRHLLEGNALKRELVAYDEAATLGLFERIRSTFTGELMQDKSGGGDPSPLPVFVVGMPRSGTTLVEQILASHSGMFGAGELETFGDAVARLGAEGARFPEMASSMSDDALCRLASCYLGAVRAIAPRAERVIDKLPLNFSFVGLIHLALPGARIIHVRRDPVDTCLSCFSILFGGEQPYAYDLGELGRYYRAYDALMAHWRRVMPPGVMLEVQYEDVVEDLEAQARRMVAHCGLAWEAACLAFHETQRPVRTASVAQVRQPIFRTSIGRWRPYRELLQPLLTSLGKPSDRPPP
jgi:tetratricopeptide (TPR) repeat protein